MQKLFVCLLFVVAGLGASAQNVVRDPNAQVRSVPNFNKIRVSNAISLYLSQGNSQGVAVSSEDQSVTNKIKTEVRDGVLKIYVENGAWNGWNWSNKHLKAYVTFTTLQALEASGASSVELTDPINVGNFKLELSGASSMKGAIKAGDLDFELSGASNARIDFTATAFAMDQSGASTFKGLINSPKTNFDLSGASTTEINGTTTDLVIDASGASNFRGSDFTAVTCKVEATGASSASINVSKEIQATASGGSTIRYDGAASITNIDVTGGSSVKKKS
ncbi:MAG TPA: head GIN domain-containing protein [Parafilimonas sp.]|nr:head GIN domain-containing protein [Parafilimonas sp.]